MAPLTAGAYPSARARAATQTPTAPPASPNDMAGNQEGRSTKRRRVRTFIARQRTTPTVPSLPVTVESQWESRAPGLSSETRIGGGGRLRGTSLVADCLRWDWPGGT
jgi:hypothetical protein